MVQIQINGLGPQTVASGDDMFMVELQGSLEAQGVMGQDHRLAIGGMHVGELDIQQDKATMYIQNHVLEGRKVALAKPLVLLRKVDAQADAAHDDMQCDASPVSASYDAVHVIRHKYLFKTRPEHTVAARNQQAAATPANSRRLSQWNPENTST
ncbi:Ctf8-domain-containing protein [Entophlyctis helioformis]|nr:Ctf8-domain-containing protein [Entophlyctis helioformis]